MINYADFPSVTNAPDIHSGEFACNLFYDAGKNHLLIHDGFYAH